MKFFLYIIIGVLFLRSEVIFSQTGRDKVEALRVAYITKRVELTLPESEKFWPVYNEYSDKIKMIRRNLRQNYRRAPENPSEQEAEQLYLLFIQSKQAEADVHKQYNEKLKLIIGTKKMVKLHLAEEEFRAKVMDSLNPKAEND